MKDGEVTGDYAPATPASTPMPPPGRAAPATTLREISEQQRALLRPSSRKGSSVPVTALAASGNDKTIVVFTGDFDKAMAAFIIANGAAAMGSKVTMFFTFWGLNILRKPETVDGQEEPDREDVRLDDAPRRGQADAVQDEHGRHGHGDDQGHHEEEERHRRCPS